MRLIIFYSNMNGRGTVVPLGVHVRPGLNEIPRNVHVGPEGSMEQGGCSIVVSNLQEGENDNIYMQYE